MVIRLVGKNHPELAIELMGWVVSIPVFCDSGFVILNPIRKGPCKPYGNLLGCHDGSSCQRTLYFACVHPADTGTDRSGFHAWHRQQYASRHGNGCALLHLPLIAGYFYANYIGKKVTSDDEANANDVKKTYEELVAEYGKLPNGFNALAPIIIPIILMGLSSIASMAGWTGLASDILQFLGTPIIALAVGTVFGVIQLAGAKKLGNFYKLTDDTLKTVGPILFVTAAGGVLGKVISSTDMINYITQNAALLETIGIFFPFILAAILKTAQGSSTVALTTTAGIVAPILPVLGLATPVRTALTVMAIGAGAMTVSHANDSYFWL